jgi:type I restriction enzyme S subunit
MRPIFCLITVGNEISIRGWNNTISTEAALKLGAHIFPENTIVFPKVGGAMLTNKRRITCRRSCVDNNIMGCVVKDGLLSFVFLLFRQIDFGKLCKPGPVPAISEGEVREIRVALPPEQEQDQIVRWAEARTSGLNRAMAIANHELSLLRDFRSRLVADVVTGNLDVRAAAAALPETAKEPLLLDDAEETGEEAPEDADERDLEEVGA